MSDAFDYIIVGAGSAGCVLANRLTEDPATRVLLLEAGGRDRSPNIKIPAAFAKQFHTKLDWDFSTEPEPHVDGRSLYMPRGKSLGGSSSMNAMLYVRGRPLDYDLWEAQGAAGLGLARRAALLHEVRGQRARRVGVPRRGRAAAGVRAALAARRRRPPPDRRQRGGGHPAASPTTTGPSRTACRCSRSTSATAGAGAPPTRSCARRSNGRTSRCCTRTRVLGVELEGDRAVGVRVARGRGREQLDARRARGDPAARARSTRRSCCCLAASARPTSCAPSAWRRATTCPGVGRNLQDHPFVTLIWEVSDQNTLYGADKPKPLAEWVLRRTGPLTSTVAEVVAFVRTRAGLPAADIQFHMGAAYYEDHGAETYDGHCAVIAPVLVSPQARGRVWLRSADPDRQAAHHHQHAVRARRRALAGRRHAARARDRRAGPHARDRRLQELKPGPGPARPRGSRSRPAPAPDADLPPRRHLPDERHGRGRGGRLPTARPRARGPARGRRVGHAASSPAATPTRPTIMIAERAADLIRSGR